MRSGYRATRKGKRDGGAGGIGSQGGGGLFFVPCVFSPLDDLRHKHNHIYINETNDRRRRSDER